MKKNLMIMFMMVIISLAGCGKETPEVIVKKGSLPDIGNGKIEIREDFYIGKYEVTQREFEAIMGFNPSYFKGDNLPVEQVTWYDAVIYCNELSKKEKLPAYYSISGIEKNKNGNIIKANVSIAGGKGYRLPTEMEWEYAARGGNKSKGYKYSGSENIDYVAWYINNSNGKTNPVGTKAANELGIYDMSGNVWEWCWDLYDNSSLYCRMIRSGSWENGANSGRVRDSDNVGKPNKISNDFGFRVLRIK